MELDIIKNSTTWNDASASINNNFAKVKTALEQGGGGGGNANVLVINSDVDFNLSEGFNTTGGIINDKNITYAKVQEAVDNGYTIALKEPSGNISYCIKAEYAVPNQNGEKRIIIFFSWRIGDEQYAATLYVGLDSSLSYAKWKLDLATKDYVDDAETAAKQYADDNKVAKVEGKQLSTEDFTTELKQKLDGLTNYDDADVRLAITALQNNLDAIVNGDATSAIDSIQEILAFLSTITDTQTLAGIVADLKQYVDDKVASGGGGITEEKEVYIGEAAPTDENVKVWIDPTGTPSSPSQPSAGVEVIDNLESDSTTAALSANQGRVLKEMIVAGGGNAGGSSGSGEPYFLPLGCIEDSYTFSAAEAQKFKEAISRADTTYHFGYVEGNFMIYLPLQAEIFNKGRMYLRGIQSVATADAFGMVIWVFFIEYNDESVICTFEQFSKNIE